MVFSTRLFLHDCFEYRHTNEATVSRLSEIGGARISVHFGMNFIHSRKGVHHNAVLWHTRECFRVHNIDAARMLVVSSTIAEALFLNSRLVDDIGERKGILEILGFFKVGTLLLEIGGDLAFHSDQFGRDQEELFE